MTDTIDLLYSEADTIDVTYNEDDGIDVIYTADAIDIIIEEQGIPIPGPPGADGPMSDDGGLGVIPLGTHVDFPVSATYLAAITPYIPSDYPANILTFCQTVPEDPIPLGVYAKQPTGVLLYTHDIFNGDHDGQAGFALKTVEDETFAARPSGFYAINPTDTANHGLTPITLVPKGGTTGQAMLKASGADFDAEWGDVAGGGSGQTEQQVQDAIDASLAATNVGGVLSGDLLAPGFAVDMASQGELDALADDLTTEATTRATADALLVPKTTTVNGHALSANVTVSASDVGLGNVDNTADSAKTFTESQVTNLTTDLAAKVAATRTIAGLDLSADRSASALRTALGLVIGTDVQAYHANLAAIAAATTPGTTGLVVLAATNAAGLRAALGSGTPSSSNFLRGDSTWAAPTVAPTRYVLPASALAAGVHGTPMWAQSSAAASTLNLAVGVIVFYRSYIDSQQTVTLTAEITATSATSGQLFHFVCYALGTNGLPTGAALWTQSAPANATGIIDASATQVLPAQPFGIALWNPNGNAGTVTFRARQPGEHIGYSFTTPGTTDVRPALLASGAFTSAPNASTLTTVDTSSSSTKWAINQQMPIVLGKA